jgi:hypothetical protein
MSIDVIATIHPDQPGFCDGCEHLTHVLPDYFCRLHGCRIFMRRVPPSDFTCYTDTVPGNYCRPEACSAAQETLYQLRNKESLHTCKQIDEAIKLSKLEQRVEQLDNLINKKTIQPYNNVRDTE